MAISSWNPFKHAALSVNLFLTLYKSNVHLVRKLEEQLQPFGLTLGRLCLLVALRRFGKPMLPSELGDDLAVTRANISGLLNALEKMEMVRREFDPSDRRRILVHLTAKGTEVLDRAWPIYEQSVAAGLERLTQQEQETLLHLLEKLG